VVLVVAVLVAVAGVTGCGTAVTVRDGVQHAGPDGSLSAPDIGGGYGMSAPAGSFPGGVAVRIGAAGAAPATGNGRWVAEPVAVRPGAPPAYPVTLTLAAGKDLDPAAAVGVLWERPDRIELLPVQGSADSRWTVLVPHFSNVGVLSFPDSADLVDWQTRVAADAIVGWLKDFFDAPNECPQPAFSSQLLITQSYPVSTSAQIDVSDDPTQSGAVKLGLCNHSSFALWLDASGAGTATAVLFPRASFPLDVPLHGTAGDPFTVTTSLSRESLVVTAALLLLPAVPGGSTVVRHLVKYSVDPDVVPMLLAGAQSCAPVLDATVAGNGAGGVLSCLSNLSSFQDALIQLIKHEAVDYGVEQIEIPVPVLEKFIAAQGGIRLLAEYLTGLLPTRTEFDYRLTCAASPDSPACRSAAPPPPRAPPPATPTPVPTPNPGPTTTEQPAPQADISLERTWTRDMQGHDKSAFRCGEKVQLTTLARNSGGADAAFTITFAAFQGNYYSGSIFNYQQSVTMKPGEAGYYSPATLPANASGTYQVSISVASKDGSIDEHGNANFTVSC
jgi:hypothetical protein